MIRNLGKYTITEKIGEGTWGPVYKGHDEPRGRPVAIRVISEAVNRDPDLNSRFHNECRSIAALEHPNIVTIHALGHEGDTTYIVMEFLEGKDLSACIEQKLPLTIEEKISMMIQVAEGLNHAHLNGILHRNIKPGNFLLTYAGNIKILDFSMGRIAPSNPDSLRSNPGSRMYVSPEQILGKQYCERSEIFSTGIIFYELVTYVHPFHDKNDARALDNVLKTLLPTVERFPDTPLGVWPILETCLAKDPIDRYRSMADLASACRELLKDLTEASQLIVAELEGVFPRLKHGAELPGSSLKMAKLARDVDRVLKSSVKRDYLSLQGVMAALAEHHSFLQSVPEPTSPSLPRQPNQNLTAIEKDGQPVRSFLEPDEKPAACDHVPASSQPAQPLALNATPESAGRLEAVGPEPEPRLEETETGVSAQIQNEENASQAIEKSSQAEVLVICSEAKPEASAAQNSSSWLSMPKKSAYQLGAVALVLVVVVLAGFRIGVRSTTHPDLTAQIAAARTSLDLKLFDSAIAACEQILAANPNNQDAKMVLVGAQKEKDRLHKVSEVNRVHEPALVLSQSLHTESSEATPPVEDKTLQQILGNAAALIRTGKLEQAKIEIDKGVRLRPSSREALALRRRWKAKDSEAALNLSREQEEQRETARKHREEEFVRQVAELYRQGNYTQAHSILDQWLAEEPENVQAKELLHRTTELQKNLKIYELAIGDKRYDDAMNALAKLEQTNPADPNLSGLRQRVSIRKAVARGTLTVYRMGEPGTLTLDNAPLGSNGEVVNERIPLGSHKLTVQNSRGLQASATHDFADGQHVAYVYDAENLILRPIAEKDRETVTNRKLMEQVHRFPVEHHHGMLRGKCRGELVMSYFDVEYKPSAGSHGFRLPFRSLKLATEAEKIDLSYATDNQEFRSFKAQDLTGATALRKVWDKLQSLDK